MSKHIAEEQGKEIEQPEYKEFELIEVQDNGTSKTFVYRDPDEENTSKSFWRKLLGKKSCD